ncbi:MAG: hypothetical protein Q7S55_01015 [Nanoarchaeota archaeon]|nr:hypothetical protein [Nanoarchaeota archaeon]
MEAEELYVEVGEMTKAHSPDSLWTDGLGPCIAVAVYDPVTKSGYLMHALPHTSLEPKIEEMSKDYGDLSRLRVFVTGNSMSFYNGIRQDKFDLSERSYVEGIMTKYFNKRRTTIQWLPDNHCGELHLDTSTGKFKAGSETMDELLYDECEP